MAAPSSTVQPASVSNSTEFALDDFAEFLADSYAEWTTACEEQGWVARFAFHPAGHVLVVHDVLSGPVEVTDDGRPLPASPLDVTGWLLTSHVGTQRVPATASVSSWTHAVAVLLAAGR